MSQAASGLLVDISVGCLTEFDPQAEYAYYCRRISSVITDLNFAQELSLFFSSQNVITPEKIEKLLEEQPPERRTIPPLRINKAILMNGEVLVNPNLCHNLLLQLSILFEVMSSIDIPQTFRFLGCLFSRNKQQNQKKDKEAENGRG